MFVTVDGTPQEIADLLFAVRNRQPEICSPLITLENTFSSALREGSHDTNEENQEVIKMDTVFDNIRAECARNRITIEELAEQLGIERKTFYNWESKKDFPVSMLKRMANIFGITTDKLLGIEQH